MYKLGGPVALQLGLGRDATTLFELHHTMCNHKKIYNIMSKYEIKDDDMDIYNTDIDMNNSYDWHKQGDNNNDNDDDNMFYIDLISAVKNYFIIEAKKRGISVLQGYIYIIYT